MPIEPREALPRKEIVGGSRITSIRSASPVARGFDLKEFDPSMTPAG